MRPFNVGKTKFNTLWPDVWSTLKGAKPRDANFKLILKGVVRILGPSRLSFGWPSRRNFGTFWAHLVLVLDGHLVVISEGRFARRSHIAIHWAGYRCKGALCSPAGEPHLSILLVSHDCVGGPRAPPTSRAENGTRFARAIFCASMKLLAFTVQFAHSFWIKVQAP